MNLNRAFELGGAWGEGLPPLEAPQAPDLERRSTEAMALVGRANEGGGKS